MPDNSAAGLAVDGYVSHCRPYGVQDTAMIPKTADWQRTKTAILGRPRVSEVLSLAILCRGAIGWSSLERRLLTTRGMSNDQREQGNLGGNCRCHMHPHEQRAARG